MRRVQWEARIHAVAIATALGEALGGRGRGGGPAQRTSADGLMAAMGARWG